MRMQKACVAGPGAQLKSGLGAKLICDRWHIPRPPAVVNEPAALKAKLEAQYKLWAAKQYDAWLATQGGAGLKWQSSYAGVPLKLKGKEGAAQYFATLNADLDIQSYKVNCA